VSSTEAERILLGAYLGSSRAHVVGILDDLSDDDLRRPMLPSGWTSLGLIQHLALDVERFWFRAVIAGDQEAIASFVDAPDAWSVGADVPSGAVFELYRDEISRSDRILATASLDAAPAWWPDHFGTERIQSIREIVLHVLVETASHTGHLDAVRELIDGRQWLVLD
jgi:uncharacterized damage-inducible protein DinB